MKVVIPYRNLHPDVPRVLGSYGMSMLYVYMEHEYSYCELMRELWEKKQSVLIVEQDILPWYGLLEEMHGCMGLWCTAAYRLGGGYGVYHALGCTKLSDRLMEMTAGIWDDPIHWGMIDRTLFWNARNIGQEPHPHRPPVIHLNPREYE